MIWGNKPSVLVGDFLFSPGIPAHGRDRMRRGCSAMLANASAVIAEGEVMQLRSSKNLAISEPTISR